MVSCRRHRSGALQDGPKCGMVSMTMAAEALLGENDKAQLGVEDVFAAALKGGHSKKGELFSAAAVASLCRSLVPSLEAEEITDLSSALSSPEAVARMFFPPRRRVLLVPYDVDKDQSPCLKRGTKAHWYDILIYCAMKSKKSLTVFPRCLVLGGAFLVEEEDAVGRLKSLPNVESIADGRILLLPEDDDKHAAPPEEVASSCSKVFLLARQSKSRRIFLYGLEELLASNSNLVDSGADGSGEFALPEGGVEEGLKGKAVLIEPSIL